MPIDKILIAEIRANLEQKGYFSSLATVPNALRPLGKK